MERDNQGYIILNDAKIQNNNLSKKGRKEKCFIEFNNEIYLFKTGAFNNEIWAELIASELGKQCHMNMAEYDVGILNGTRGVISKCFLQKDDSIYSGEHIFDYGKKVLFDNNVNLSNINSVENISQVLSMITKDPNDIYKITENLIRLWAFDGLIMESDRNPTNWAVIRNKEGHYALSPIYDCSTMARLNNDVSDLVRAMAHGYSMDTLIDNINQQLLLRNGDKPDQFLESFMRFCSTGSETARRIMDDFKNINVDEAINNIERRLNTNCQSEEEISIPYQVGLWTNKAINNRLDNMKYIYEAKFDKERKQR